MKIIRYGKVIVTEEDVLVTEFEFQGDSDTLLELGGEGDNLYTAGVAALEWAKAEIQQVIDEWHKDPNPARALRRKEEEEAWS